MGPRRDPPLPHTTNTQGPAAGTDVASHTYVSGQAWRRCVEQASQHKHSIQPSISAFRQPSKCTPKGAGQGGVLPVELTQRMERDARAAMRARRCARGVPSVCSVQLIVISTIRVPFVAARVALVPCFVATALPIIAFLFAIALSHALRGSSG